MKKLLRAVFVDFINWLDGDRNSNKVESSYDNHSLSSYGSKSAMPVSVRGGSSVGDYNNGMHFTMFSATGGKIIQTTMYDPRTDVTKSSLHIITDKEDLGEELAMIITRENLAK